MLHVPTLRRGFVPAARHNPRTFCTKLSLCPSAAACYAAVQIPGPPYHPKVPGVPIQSSRLLLRAPSTSTLAFTLKSLLRAGSGVRSTDSTSKELTTSSSTIASMVKTVRVDVTSDTVCPWCYVGKKNLEAAIQQLGGGLNVEVVWHPYQLNPNAPKEGVNKEAFYREKFGPAVPSIMQRMTKVFAGFGQKYSLGGLTGNTLDSHRLLWYARNGPGGSPQLQNYLVEELFLDYFTRDKYIGDRAVLVDAAERVGLSGAREFLEDPTAGLKEVKAETQLYGQGVTGVPFFRIADEMLSGAQPPDLFVASLKRAASAAA